MRVALKVLFSIKALQYRLSLVNSDCCFWRVRVKHTCHKIVNFSLGTFSFKSPVYKDEGYFHDALVVHKCLIFMAFINVLKEEMFFACIV